MRFIFTSIIFAISLISCNTNQEIKNQTSLTINVVDILNDSASIKHYLTVLEMSEGSLRDSAVYKLIGKIISIQVENITNQPIFIPVVENSIMYAKSFKQYYNGNIIAYAIEPDVLYYYDLLRESSTIDYYLPDFNIHCDSIIYSIQVFTGKFNSFEEMNFVIYPKNLAVHQIQ